MPEFLADYFDSISFIQLSYVLIVWQW